MTFYTQDNYHPANSVGFVLHKAHKRLVADMDAALKGLNVKSQHVGILISLLRRSQARSTTLSRQLGVNPGLMSRMLDSLEALGLLMRSRDRQDRRAVNVRLTDVGRATARRIRELTPEVLNARLHGFTEAEFVELRRLLYKLIEK
ncbi:MarR family winged helix-turn-helix transcriptional regulator [Paraburkholderia humisilvae]|uniref:Transcriptional regulator SlyA n=1 Tax=Paraburkholderia humisilvae TaxID=627669 RepID=A0A6J5DU24_9BURK|nr:MarR family transcriptional regulator [Paraburkholderia humisilvae]CAB3756522.1 Transcriptional regulator SlyA [Paraburkholderia humisilvae]